MEIESRDVQVDAQWARVCDRMRAEIGDAAFQSWLKPMTVRGVTGGCVKISVPTRFMRDWVLAHYAERLSTIWGSEDPAVNAVDVFVQTDRSVRAAAEPVAEDVAETVEPAPAAGNDETVARLSRPST